MDIDAIRNITGGMSMTTAGGGSSWIEPINCSGAFQKGGTATCGSITASALRAGSITAYFNSGNVVPIGAVNRPRSFGVLACAYMGKPAL